MNYKKEITSLIPKPVIVNRVPGYIKITDETSIYTEKIFTKEAKYLQQTLNETLNLEIPIATEKKTNSQIIIEFNPDPYLPFEGYVINSISDVIYLNGNSANGVFYGIQTLRQLLLGDGNCARKANDLLRKIPCLIIRDYPRFKWRGFMLDEARHFMGKEVVKQILDLMAFHKLNKFHWHLVDDQGWRIEIKKCPKLTEIGSRRKLKRRRGERALPNEPNTYGGFYTQEEIKEIVAYAKDRFIEIIPEIEIPGHSSSALAAYPELSCFEEKIGVPTKWLVLKNVYCPGKKNVYDFLENVLEEIITLFPSKIIHIGGDEVLKKNWKSCPNCQRKMQENNMQVVEELQGYITNYFAKYLKTKGKQLMGWYQIINPKLEDNIICQLWFGNDKEGRKFINNGGEVVASNMFQTYLDYPYFLISLKKAYKFEPIPKELSSEKNQNILGLEAPLWTERVSNPKRLYHQVFPRLIAYAETAWTPKFQKNYKSFIKRLVKIMTFLEKKLVPKMLKMLLESN